jgi:hypothetical protein
MCLLFAGVFVCSGIVGGVGLDVLRRDKKCMRLFFSSLTITGCVGVGDGERGRRLVTVGSEVAAIGMRGFNDVDDGAVESGAEDGLARNEKY